MSVIQAAGVLGKEIIKTIPNPRKIRWTRKKVLFTVLLVGAVVWFISQSGVGTEEAATATTPEVVVSPVGNLAGGGAFAVTGSVEAVAEAQLKAEAGGRVVAVNTEIGKFVTAGTIIARLDNASEQAALLQAQGAYQAALAASRQGTVGVAEAATALQTAERGAVVAFASSYNTVTNLVKSDIDAYFANPTSPLPGLRLNGFGDTPAINSARVALNTTLANWQRESTALTTSGQLDAALENGRRYTGEVVALTDRLIAAIERDTSGGAADAAARAAKSAQLSATRGALLGVQTALQGQLAGLASARDAKTRAEINATGGNGPSASDAQITQALGALRGAQAQYEKTLVRTPISGVVNALYIKAGDFVSPQADAAIIANNNGKQVSSAITEADRNLIAVGDIVTFDGVATGTVTAIAGAVDPKTGKVAIKMSVSTPELLTTGANVSVAFADQMASSTPVDAPIAIPLTAVKLMASGAVVFTVNSDNKLESREVKLGRVLGDTVIVTEGLDRTTSIVIDARGLKAGEVVTIKN